MKKVFSLLITLAMLVSVVVMPMPVSADASVWDGTTVVTDWAGEGTQASPYLITSAAELAGLASIVYNANSTTTGAVAVGEKGVYELYTGTYFKLTTDIDLGGEEWLPIGRLGMRFNGNFEGGCHLIKNLKVNTNHYGMALFGGTGRNASISNIGIEGANFTFNGGVTVSDYPAEGKDESYFALTYLTDKNADGVQTTITNTRVWGVASLVGVFGGGSITNCYAKGVNITNTSTSVARNAGGLMGAAYSAVSNSTPSATMTVTDCYVNGATLTGNCGRCGGFYGSTKYGSSGYDHGVIPTFTNCYVANASGSFTWGFGDGDSNPLQESKNCWTTKAFYTGNSASRVEKDKSFVKTKAEIINAFVSLNTWSADNDKALTNDGFPVLKWQNTWSDKWDGTSVDTTWAGLGTEADPYLITSAAELYGLAKTISETNAVTAGLAESVNKTSINGSTVQYYIYTGKHFKLMTDIDLAGKDWLPIGSFGIKFDGSFDGNNHVVKNLAMTTQRSAAGVFGATGTHARIKNIGVENVDITTPIGSLAEVNDWDTNRCVAFGGLIGSIEPGGSATDPMLKGCFARDVYIKPTANEMGIQPMGGLVGAVAGWTNVSSSNDYHRYYITDCYVKDVVLYSHTNIGGFIGGGNPNYTYPAITNCYVAGNINLNHTTGKKGYYRYTLNEETGKVVSVDKSSELSLRTGWGDNWAEEYERIAVATNTAGAYDLHTKTTWNSVVFNLGWCASTSWSQAWITNCYIGTNEYTNFSLGANCSLTYTTDAAVIAKGLVTGDGAWNLDNVENPINGGYPILGWEKWWTTESDPLSSFMGAGVTVADGYVTDVTLVQNDSAVSGTVIVAVYNGNHFVNAVTATATNGAITLATPVAVETGNTVKVFVWDSLAVPSPLALVYSTTVAE